MPVGEIGEAFFRVVFRIILSFVVETLLGIVCFYVGLPVVKFTTFGKYPEDKPTKGQEVITSTVGFLLLLLVVMWLTGILR